MKTGVGVLRVVRASIVASGVAAALLLGITTSASAGTLDQQQTSFGQFSSGGINSNQSLAQIFTAGITGSVDQADLVLSKFSTPTQPVTIEIRNVAAGLPGNTVLATTSIPASAIPADPNPAFVSATFGTPAPVMAGAQYALVAWSMDMAGGIGWSYQPDPANPYPAGRAVNDQASPPDGVWQGPDGDDFAFKTYVVPAPPAQPAQPAPHRKKCKKHRKKHKSGAQIAKKKCKKKHRH
jgi:hypothetical protein